MNVRLSAKFRGFTEDGKKAQYAILSFGMLEVPTTLLPDPQPTSIPVILELPEVD